MSSLRLAAALAALVVAVATPSHAQTRRPAQALPRADALVPGIPDSVLLAELGFRSIGPAVMSGRIADIAVPAVRVPGERWGKVIFVAAAAGGVWKSTNGGVTWAPIFDAVRYSSIGAVAVAPSNDSILYVGTGESNNLRSSSWGAGVYRSTDGGATWTPAGLERSQHVARIVVHPRQPDVVFVAAMGPLWAAGGERGLYKTTDGGRTWRRTLGAGPYTGVTDIVLDPSNPDVVYAATCQRDRRAYSFVAGGPESGLWKSTDGGETWVELTRGLPPGDLGRIGIAVAPSRPQTLYATISTTAAAPGTSRSTCRSPPSTPSPPTIASRITSSTAASRTTVPGAVRPDRGHAPASPTPTGRAQVGVTASMRPSIPPTRTSSTSSRRTARSAASISPRKSGSPSGPPRRRASRCAGTGARP